MQAAFGLREASSLWRSRFMPSGNLPWLEPPRVLMLAQQHLSWGPFKNRHPAVFLIHWT
jgi:hypothetical protein